MSDIELELHVDGELTAGADGPREEAYAEMRRYWAQYCNDGKCSVYEVTRKQIPIVDLLGLAQETKEELSPFVVPFRHWRKDCALPYDGCNCESCEEVRAEANRSPEHE